MTEKLFKSIEQYKIPISIAKLLSVISFCVFITWLVTSERDTFHKNISDNSARCNFLEREVVSLKAYDKEAKANSETTKIKLAEIQKDVSWIRLMLERNEK